MLCLVGFMCEVIGCRRCLPTCGHFIGLISCSLCVCVCVYVCVRVYMYVTLYMCVACM